MFVWAYGTVKAYLYSSVVSSRTWGCRGWLDWSYDLPVTDTAPFVSSLGPMTSVVDPGLDTEELRASPYCVKVAGLFLFSDVGSTGK